MHHPTDRIAHTTAFVTPVVEHWLKIGTVSLWLRTRASTHCVMGRETDPLDWTDWASSCSSRCSTTIITKAVCGMVHIKYPLLLLRVAYEMVALGFLSYYLINILQYV